jgi:hypothetical protein
MYGSAKESMNFIGAPGFEPGTSPTRTVRATRLRHAPKAAIISETLGRARCWGPGRYFAFAAGYQ